MTTAACLVLYGNSVFLAGIKTELECRLAHELITVEAGSPNALELIRTHRPGAVLFDLSMAQPDFAIPLLREQPGTLMIGVDVNRDEMLVLSSHPAQALSITDLLNVICQKDSELSAKTISQVLGKEGC